MIAGNVLRRVATRGLMSSSSSSLGSTTTSKLSAPAAARFFSSDVATFNVEGSFEVRCVSLIDCLGFLGWCDCVSVVCWVVFGKEAMYCFLSPLLL